MSKSKSRLSVGLGISALAGVGVAAYMSGRRAVPGFSGTVRLSMLDAPVEVVRDQWGVPAVFAKTDLDAYRVQGWLHASDRAFQLDLLRRVGLGRLAEVVGEAGIGSDRLVRTLGFGQHVEGDLELVTPEVREGLAAFTEGVNAGFERVRRRPPVEYRLLGYRPEPWRLQDCMVLARLMALGLCGNWESELARGEILARFGPDVVEGLEDDAHPTAWPAQIDAAVLGELVTGLKDATSTFGGPGGIGSNNWVISPDRTRTGGALLANDPHLDLQLPSVWYEQRLQGSELDVRGFTFPGVPGVVLGHNGRIAWGFTNSSIDVQDCYLEQLDERGERYRDTDGEWKPLERRTERIRVKGRPDVVLSVRSTRRGPIITDAAVTSHVEHPVSLRWDAIRPNRGPEMLHRLNRAGGWEEFRAACALWTAPAQNVVYADARGNIGFQHMGEVPIRAEGGDGSVPLRGDDPQGEWVGVVPWEDHPHAFNPTAGRIVTANDRLVGDDYPWFFSREWMNGYRGQRIRELVDSISDHAVGDQVRIQADVRSLPGIELVEHLRRLQVAPSTQDGQDVLAALLAWDGELRAGADDSAAWRLFQRALQDRVFGFLGELLPRFLGYSRTGVGGFWAMFGRSTPRLIAAIASDDRELLELGRRAFDRHGAGEDVPPPLEGWVPARDWVEALADALDLAGTWWAGRADDEERATSRSLPKTQPVSAAGAAAETATRAAGARVGLADRLEQRLMRRRRYHRLRLQHPLGVLPGLAQIANRGPYPVPGDPDTVWQSSQYNNTANDHAMVGPSHRHVVDMADPDRSVAVLCGGQSGHPASPHYVDQVSMWRRGDVRPAPFSRRALEKAARYRQRFEP